MSLPSRFRDRANDCFRPIAVISASTVSKGMFLVTALLFGLSMGMPDQAVGLGDPSSGAWAGPLRLCRTNVESAEVISDTYDGNRPTLLVKLTAPAAKSWSKITAQLVGRELPVRLDGTVIARPIVLEPIEAGTFQVSGADRSILIRMANRVSEPC